MERRAHRRLPLRLPLDFRAADDAHAVMTRTSTNNVSTGGLYFQTTAEDISPDQQLQLELEIPADRGRFPAAAAISATGRVVRVDCLDSEPHENGCQFARYGVAVEFLEDLRLIL